MPRYHIKSSVLQWICCGDTMVTRRKIIALVTAMALFSAAFTVFILYTVTKHVMNSDNRYIQNFKDTGMRYKNKLMEHSHNAWKPIQNKIQPIQDNIQDTIDKYKIKKKVIDTAEEIKNGVEAIHGQAGSVIKRVRNDPNQFLEDTQKQAGEALVDLHKSAEDTAKSAGKAVADAGKLSMDTAGDLQRKGVDLYKDVHNHPQKYKKLLKQKSHETYDDARDKSLDTYDALKKNAAVVQNKAAESLKAFEVKADKAADLLQQKMNHLRNTI